MTRLCTKLVESIPSEYFGRLQQNFESLAALQLLGLATIGTACSGTDLFTPALAMLMDVMCTVLGVACVHWTHVWSCEFDKMKQFWLASVMQVQNVVADIHDLATGGWCVMADGATRFIEGTLLFTCGFSCKSVSFQNKDRTTYCGCLATGDGTTGRTYKSAMRFIRKHLPFFVFLENVKGLGKRDRTTVKRHLQRLGYAVIIIESDVLSRGLPVRRTRVWFIAVLAPAMSPEQCREAQRAAEWFTHQTRQVPLDISEVLLDPADPDYALWQDKVDAKVATKRLKAKHWKWGELHARVLARRGVSQRHLRRIAAQKSVKEFLRAGKPTEREAQVVQMEIAFHPKDHNDSDVVIFDISQGADRVPRGVNCSPTVLPSAK